MELVSSAANPLVKRMRALAQRKHRAREGVAVVHGAQPVRQAAEAGAAIEALVVAPGLVHADSTLAFVEEQRARGTRVVAVTDDVFGRLADDVRPTGIAAIVEARWASPDTLAVPGPVCTVVALDRIGNPGNLGTIIRTADAAGADGVLLVGPTADPYDPAAVKASMGAIFDVAVARLPDVDALFGWAARGSVEVVTTSGGHGTSAMWDTRFPERTVLLMGPEGDGLSADVVARGDLSVSIPMVGTVESLNVAVATGLLLYERRRTIG
jgi:RNA methyltransferase, TrmH family